MSNIIRELHEIGRSDAWISQHLGMDRDEILRLKQITGLTALFRDVDFGQAWRPAENYLQQFLPETSVAVAKVFTDEELLDATKKEPSRKSSGNSAKTTKKDVT